MIEADTDDDNAVMMRELTYQARRTTLVEQGRSTLEATAIACVENPFNYLIYHEEGAIPGFSLGAKKYEKFWNKFNHKYLHIMAVARCSYNRPDSVRMGSAEAATCLVYTTEELKRFLREEVAITHPQEAELLFLLLSKPAR